MNTNNMIKEQISAFADGELATNQMDAIFVTLHSPEGRAAWTAHHEIGDMIRSDDLEFSFSPGFSVRMSARLDTEAALVAPGIEFHQQDHQMVSNGAPAGRRAVFKRFAMPTITAAAALAAIGFVSAPQIMTAMNNFGRTPSALIAAVSPREAALHDLRIDDYLLAHQQFSPSLYSTAQYARSATFAIDTDK
jgi:sigma-E factor negative regulatory protein RseA